MNWYNNTPGGLDSQEYNCGICKNKGKVMYFKDGTEYLKECMCMAQRFVLKQSRDYLTRYGIDFATTTFESYEATEDWQIRAKREVMSYAEHFAERQKTSLCIAGQNGAGKSHLAIACCGKLIQDGFLVRFEDWRNLVQQLDALKFNSDEYSEKMKSVQEAEVLFLDDLLRQKDQKRIPSELNLAFEIFNARVRAGKPTIITSELLMDDLFKTDAGLAGRIKQSSILVQIKYEAGRDYRAKSKTQSQ